MDSKANNNNTCVQTTRGAESAGMAVLLLYSSSSFLFLRQTQTKSPPVCSNLSLSHASAAHSSTCQHTYHTAVAKYHMTLVLRSASSTGYELNVQQYEPRANSSRHSRQQSEREARTAGKKGL